MCNSPGSPPAAQTTMPSRGMARFTAPSTCASLGSASSLGAAVIRSTAALQRVVEVARHQFVEAGSAGDRVITAINFGVQLRYGNVEPAITPGFVPKKSGITFNDGVFRGLKSEITICLMKGLVGFFGVNYPGKSAWLGHRNIVFTSRKKKRKETNGNQKPGECHDVG